MSDLIPILGLLHFMCIPIGGLGTAIALTRTGTDEMVGIIGALVCATLYLVTPA